MLFRPLVNLEEEGPVDVKLTINGEEKSASVPPETTLLRLLREEFNLTGAKIGCDVGDCGALSLIHISEPTRPY